MSSRPTVEAGPGRSKVTIVNLVDGDQDQDEIAAALRQHMGPSSNGDGVHHEPKEDGALARWRPWNERSKDLATWALERMVNRRDRHGRYFVGREGKTEVFTSGDLTDAMVLKHFRARDVKDVIGLLAAVHRDVEGTGRGVSLSRWLRIDIDCHPDDGSNPDANLGAALAWHDRLIGLSFRPILADSNGNGGHWLDVIFEEPVLTTHARRFGLWLTGDWEAHALAGAPKVFPKQFEVKASGPGECGNWARLYGRHHTRDHWTKVYADGEWLEGEEAIEAIVNTVGDSARLIPAEALEFERDRKGERAEREARPRTDAELEGEAAKAKEALSFLGPGKKDKQGREFVSDYDHWLQIGFALHELGDDGFRLWVEWSAQCEAKFDEEVCAHKWGTMKDEGIGLGTLLKLASDMGRKGPWRVEATSPLPQIVCGSDDPSEGLKRWTPEAVQALGKANQGDAVEVFQHDGILCRVKPGDSDGPPAIDPLGIDSLRGILDRAARWGETSQTRKGPRTKWGPPRIDIVRDLLALGSYDLGLFPPIDLIVESPRFLPDGTLVSNPGYHRAGRFFYAPSPDLAGIGVPDDPTSRQVEEAKALLLDDLLVDFPFANLASKANALAVTLVPFVRQMIDGPTPNHHIEASTEGTGKGLLAAATGFPSLHREIDLNPQKEGEAEWRKAITSALISGCTHFLIDNMYNPTGWDNTPMPVDSGTLAMAWTARYWRDRLLGGNREVRVKVQTVFMSTGNNVVFSRKLDRRLVRIELMAPCENPSQRTGFKHDPLLDWARENRRALTLACLTLCRRWIADGMPNGTEVAGSYSNYVRVMGGILGSCGVEKFLANGVRKVARNPEAERWKMLVEEWLRIHKEALVSTGQLRALIIGNEGLGERFHDVLGDGGELSQKQKLGRALNRVQGRVCGNWRIVRAETTTGNKAALWKLQDPTIRQDDESGVEVESCVPF